MSKPVAKKLLALFGLACVASCFYGLWLIYPPLAFVLGGAMGIWFYGIVINEAKLNEGK